MELSVSDCVLESGTRAGGRQRRHSEARFHLSADGISVGQRPRQLAVGVGGRVYVTSFNSNEVFALDQERSRVVGEPVTVAVNPFGLAAGAGSVWVGSLPDDTLTELATGRVG
jgi:DNA-binding beta-propeller fold protein YncE